MSVIQILEQQFSGETFTHFAVMTWAPVADLDQWKIEFHELVDSGHIVEVEQRPLGMVYKVAAHN